MATLLEEAFEESRCVVSITPLDIVASGPSLKPSSTSVSVGLRVAGDVRSLVFPSSEVQRVRVIGQFGTTL